LLSISCAWCCPTHQVPGIIPFMCILLPYSLVSWKYLCSWNYPFYVHFIALLTSFLEVLIDCMTYRMYWFVVAWKVLHATFS
jgi:hypothetical protein